MTLNELRWLGKFLVSKQIDSAAYVHTISALFVEVLWIVFFSNTAIDNMDVGGTELKILQVTRTSINVIRNYIYQ